MKFLRKTYWYITAFVKKRWLVIVGAVFLSFLIIPFLFYSIVPLLHLKKTQYIGRIGTVTISTLPRDIQEKISDGLTKIDASGAISPGLAERWSIEDEGKTYRFVLRQHSVWQDGKKISPEDLQYNFSDTQVVVTQNDVVFKVKDVFSPFLSIVSQPVFREEKGKIIGTGEFSVKKITKKGSVIQEIHIESEKERIVYRFYPAEDRAILAFKRGEVNSIEDLTDVGELQTWNTVRVTPVLHKDRYVAVFFNNTDPMLDKNTRQALNYAIAKAKGEERVFTPIHPSSWAYNKTVKSYEQNLSKAFELLFRSVLRKQLTLELTTTTAYREDAIAIQKQWEEFGNRAVEECKRNKELVKQTDCEYYRIAVTLRVTSFPDLSNFQLLLVGQQIPVDPDQYFFWHSTQSANFMHYKSPRVDKILEDGRKTLDKRERTTLYQDFQQFLVEDCPAMFLKHATTYTVERK